MYGARNRGFTLVEILVAGTLLLGMLGLISQVIVPVMRASARTSVRVELQALANVSMQKLTTDLNLVAAQGISGPFQAPNGSISFALHRNAGFSSDGKPLWSTQMVVYRWDTDAQILYRSLWPPSATNTLVSPLEIKRLQETEVDRAVADGDTRVLASSVTHFHFEKGPAGETQLPLAVALKLEKISASEVTESVELFRRILPRN